MIFLISGLLKSVAGFPLTTATTTRLTLCLLFPAQALFAAGDVSGYWVVPGKDAVVQIAESNQSIKLRVVRTFDPALLDHKNPNRDRRLQPLSKQIMGEGFVREQGHWTGGKLYDPGSGKEYKATIRSIDIDHIEVRGYIGVPALGRSQTWTRLSVFQQKMQAMLTSPKLLSTQGEQP